MSLIAIEWALTRPGLTPSEKLVLIGLADCHNGETGRCHPSARRLSERLVLPQKTVTDCLRRLRAKGLVASIPRYREDGSIAANEYQFPTLEVVSRGGLPAGGGVTNTGGAPPDHSGDPPTNPVGTPPDRAKSPLYLTGIEPEGNRNITNGQLVVDRPDQTIPFSMFWEQWPKRIKKKAAEAQWRKRKPTEADFMAILAHLQAYASSGKDIAYLPAPDIYIRDERWTDAVLAEPVQRPRNAPDYPWDDGGSFGGNVVNEENPFDFSDFAHLQQDRKLNND